MLIALFQAQMQLERRPGLQGAVFSKLACRAVDRQCLDDRGPVGRIVLDRSDAAGGPRVHLEAGPTAVAGRRPLIGFELSIRNASLAQLLNLPLGDAPAELFFAGTWEDGGPEDGLTFTGIVRWEGMIPGATIPWPVRAPRGAVSGDVMLARDHGQLFVQWARARGPDGVWLATGHLSEQGRWVLDGALLEGEQYVFPAHVPARILIASERFQIEGPLLRWSVKRERGPEHRDEVREGPEPPDGDAAE